MDGTYTDQAHQFQNSLVAKFNMGKIKSKYLIVEILAYGINSKTNIYLFLYFSSKQLRLLLNQNYLWLRKITDRLTIQDLIGASKCRINRNETQFLRKIMNQVELTLLYRGSRDGWFDKDFHFQCDGKGPTLTFFQISYGGDCVGGFT